MSTDSVRRKPALNVQTKSSAYDQINAFLISGLVLFGFLFSVLFLIWLTTIVDFSRRTEGPIVTAVDEPGNEKPKGEADDMEDPGVEEFPEVDTPQLANALEAVTNAVSSVQGALEKRSGTAAQMGKGAGFGSRDGGPGSGGDGIPEYKRWIINFSSADVDTYADQLSHFKIDIGVVNNVKSNITRLADPGGSKRVIQSNREAEKKNLYFIHKKQRFRVWDQGIAKQAGISTSEAITVQFYPEATRQLLRIAEAQALKTAGKTLVEVKNTFFKVVADGNGYKFEVERMLYR
jgi:hypothetical protein